MADAEDQYLGKLTDKLVLLVFNVLWDAKLLTRLIAVSKRFGLLIPSPHLHHPGAAAMQKRSGDDKYSWPAGMYRSPGLSSQRDDVDLLVPCVGKQWEALRNNVFEEMPKGTPAGLSHQDMVPADMELLESGYVMRDPAFIVILSEEDERISHSPDILGFDSDGGDDYEKAAVIREAIKEMRKIIEVTPCTIYINPFAT
ncbi:hypothetical protein CDL15_Pgr004295 [Punica granatum]|uniref:Uncharacterized protein n=1 Tax=Punica granatum TaxID=22663 RepID=A0A218XG16_PUNGR|nr:hypothetical protein CDL15_Pgr004295 [Punica granatum]